MAQLPRGTVTLLFTDVEGSTRLLQELGRERYVKALGAHRRLLRDAFGRHNGIEVEMKGDSFYFAFAQARDAAAAAADAQRALALHRWGHAPIRVRIGMHTGEPLVADNLYAGLDVHRAARVMSAGHGGQVVVSASTRELLSSDPPDGLSLRDLGEHHLKDLAARERLYQLDIAGLPTGFPPLNTVDGGQVEADRLDFRILGPLEAVAGGRALELGGAQRRALLAVLVLNPNQVVSIDRLIDELWGEQPPPTAAHTIQVHVSQLRKLLGSASKALVTQRPGYMIRIDPEQIDLYRFERVLGEGRQALAIGNAEAAAAKLRDALGIWRGSALADFTYQPFAQAAISRLDELRLAALEDRVEADLALGRHPDLVGELETLVKANPLRERPRRQLILALYRSGRQAEALEAYQDTRRVLVDELGIEPSLVLQELERAVLNQDPRLDWSAPRRTTTAGHQKAAPLPERSILLVSRDADELRSLLAVSEPLARSHSPHELILARLVAAPGDLEAAESELRNRQRELHERRVPSRAAAFTSADLGSDVVRLAAQQEVDLLLLDGRPLDPTGALSAEVRTILEEALCDVAVAGNAAVAGGAGAAVVVPFGAGEHDWGALELGTWAASAHDLPLRLVGTTAEPEAGRRDASRLLANAALVVQQLAGVPTESVLVPAGADGLLAAAEDAVLIVLGLSERWRQAGIGDVRTAITAQAQPPVLLVRRGPRPGGLTPRESLTRYTWSLAHAGA